MMPSCDGLMTLKEPLLRRWLASCALGDNRKILFAVVLWNIYLLLNCVFCRFCWLLYIEGNGE